MLEPDKSAFLSGLEWLGRPGQGVRNVLGGRFGSAGRQIGQMALDAVDAVLPGDWLPNDFASSEDDLSGRELIGMDDSLLGKAAGFGVDMITDPLTYIPGGVFAKGARMVGGAARAGAVKALGEEAVAAAGQHLRSTFGVIPERAAKMMASGRAASGVESAAGIGAAKTALAGLDARQMQIVGDAIDNFRWQDGHLVGELVPTTADPIRGAVTGTIADRIAAHPDLLPGEAEALAKAAEGVAGIGRQMRDRPGIFAPKTVTETVDPVMGVVPGGRAPAPSGLSDEYLGRIYEGLPEEANPLKGRSLEGWRDVQSFLAKPENAKVKYVRDALQRTGRRADLHGMLSQRADLGSTIFDEVRKGNMRLPAEMLEKALAENTIPMAGDIQLTRAGKAVVGDQFAPADMLGRQANYLDDALPNPVQSGTSVVGSGEGDAALNALSGLAPTPKGLTGNEAYGLGQQSGTAALPRSGISSRPIDLLLKGDLKAARKAVEAMAKSGEIDDATTKAYLNILDSATPAAGSADNVVEEAVASNLNDPYGLGSPSGRALPPKTGPITEAPVPDAYGIGGQSGKAAVGGKYAATNMLGKTVNHLDDAHAIGAQSGTSVVGATTAQGGRAIRDLTPSQVEEATNKILGKGFAYADEESRGLVKAAIGELAKTGPEGAENAKVLMDAFSGMAPRGTFTSWLATANRAFKPYAVYGFAIPKFGAIVRNKVSGVWQAASNPEARGVVGGQAKRFFSDLSGAFVDSLGLKISKDQLGKVLESWDGALAASGGSGEQAIALMAKSHPQAAAAIQAGALDGFVRSEDMIAEMGRIGWKKQYANIASWPARIFRGVEDRMRLGMAMDLMGKGKSADEAARIVRESLYDYSVNSVGNRTARDLIPFFQFSAKAIPQQAKFLAEKPWLMSGLSNAMATDNEDPVYPFMEGKLNIPLGGDQYVSGIGLPLEVLSSIPNPSSSLRSFGRQVEQNVVGSAQPLLKGAFSTVSGEDPYFGTEFGSFTKLPGDVEGGEFGRLYNEASSFGLPGLTQADQLLRTVGKAGDGRRGVGAKVLDLLTGANVVNVDPDRALQQRLNDALASNPNVLQTRTPINIGKDPDVAQLIQELRAVRKRVKAQKAASAVKP
jgi:hypothetical protein